MFKGTKKVGPEEYSKIIQHNGGNDNAFTSEDSTTYFATIASDRLPVVIELESDRMQNLTFDDAQFTPELHVVMEERRLRTDNNPVSALFEADQLRGLRGASVPVADHRLDERSEAGDPPGRDGVLPHLLHAGERGHRVRR